MMSFLESKTQTEAGAQTVTSVTPYRQLRATPSRLDLLRALRMHARVAAGVGVLVFLALVYVGLQMKSLYSAESLVYVQPASSPLNDPNSGALFDSVRFDSYMQQQMQTAVRIDTLKAALATLPAGTWTLPGESLQSAATRLQAALKVTRVTTTFQLSISMKGEDPVKTAEIVNAVTKAYLDAGRKDELISSNSRAQLLTAERDRITHELKLARDEQSTLSANLGVANPSGNGANAYDEQLTALRTELVGARAAHDAAAAQLMSMTGPGAHAALGLNAAANELAAGDSGLSGLKTTVNQRRAALQSQMAGMTPGNPIYKQDQVELADLDRSLASTSDQLRDQAARRLEDKLRSELDRTGDLEGRLNAELQRETAKATSASPRLQRAQELASNVARLTTRFATVDDALRTIDLETHGAPSAHLSLLAVPPMQPEASRRKMVLLASLPVALLFACLAAVLMQRQERHVYVARDIEQVLGFLPIAVLPARADVSSFVLDEYVLRLAAGIESAHRQQRAQSFVLTAASASTGTGQLLEALKVKLSDLGLSVAQVPAGAILHTTPGSALAARSQRLGARKGSETGRDSSVVASLGQLKTVYDLILIQAPPLLTSAETEYVSRCSDATIVLAECGVTTKQELLEAAALLERMQVTGVGTVLDELRLKVADGAFREAVRLVELRGPSHRPAEAPLEFPQAAAQPATRPHESRSATEPAPAEGASQAIYGEERARAMDETLIEGVAGVEDPKGQSEAALVALHDHQPEANVFIQGDPGPETVIAAPERVAGSFTPPVGVSSAVPSAVPTGVPVAEASLVPASPGVPSPDIAAEVSAAPVLAASEIVGREMNAVAPTRVEASPAATRSGVPISAPGAAKPLSPVADAEVWPAKPAPSRLASVTKAFEQELMAARGTSVFLRPRRAGEPKIERLEPLGRPEALDTSAELLADSFGSIPIDIEPVAAEIIYPKGMSPNEVESARQEKARRAEEWRQRLKGHPDMGVEPLETDDIRRLLTPVRTETRIATRKGKDMIGSQAVERAARETQRQGWAPDGDAGMAEKKNWFQKLFRRGPDETGMSIIPEAEQDLRRDESAQFAAALDTRLSSRSNGRNEDLAYGIVKRAHTSAANRSIGAALAEQMQQVEHISERTAPDLTALHEEEVRPAYTPVARVVSLLTPLESPSEEAFKDADETLDTFTPEQTTTETVAQVELYPRVPEPLAETATPSAPDMHPEEATAATIEAPSTESAVRPATRVPRRPKSFLELSQSRHTSHDYELPPILPATEPSPVVKADYEKSHHPGADEAANIAEGMELPPTQQLLTDLGQDMSAARGDTHTHQQGLEISSAEAVAALPVLREAEAAEQHVLVEQAINAPGEHRLAEESVRMISSRQWRDQVVDTLAEVRSEVEETAVPAAHKVTRPVPWPTAALAPQKKREPEAEPVLQMRPAERRFAGDAALTRRWGLLSRYDQAEDAGLNGDGSPSDSNGAHS